MLLNSCFSLTTMTDIQFQWLLALYFTVTIDYLVLLTSCFSLTTMTNIQFHWLLALYFTHTIVLLNSCSSLSTMADIYIPLTTLAAMFPCSWWHSPYSTIHQMLVIHVKETFPKWHFSAPSIQLLLHNNGQEILWKLGIHLAVIELVQLSWLAGCPYLVVSTACGNWPIPYSGFISREKIFVNFADLSQFAKILFANIACACCARLRLLVLIQGVWLI